MELRFLEGNFEHGKFKLQMRKDGCADQWEDVPCVPKVEEPKRKRLVDILKESMAGQPIASAFPMTRALYPNTGILEKMADAALKAVFEILDECHQNKFTIQGIKNLLQDRLGNG